MIAHNPRFDELVEIVDRLPVEEREALLDVLQKRLVEDQRRKIEKSIRAARRAHARGKTKAVSVDELMREIME